MRKYLLVIPLSLLPFNVFAGDAPASSKQVYKPVICFKLDEGLNFLKSEFGETIKRKMGTNPYSNTEFFYLENEDGTTWTLLEFKDDVGCAVAAGKNDKKA